MVEHGIVVRAAGTMRRTMTRLALAHVALLIGAACAPGGSDRERPNVLLIAVDTLRADHLESYGYRLPTSPALAELGATGVVFERAVAATSWTLPAFASVLTGHYTSTHRCWKHKSRLAPSFVTLPEILRDAGYDTACAISHIFLARRYGLQQGIVHFDTSFDLPVGHGDTEISSPGVTARGLEWIEHKAAAGDGEPWFLWLHYFDPHYKYVEHEGISETFGVEDPLERYDGEIRFTDGYIGEVLDALARTGLDESTIVVLVADHGEEFLDHGGQYHGHTLYQELVHVPLVVRAPGSSRAGSSRRCARSTCCPRSWSWSISLRPETCRAPASFPRCVGTSLGRERSPSSAWALPSTTSTRGWKAIGS